MAVGVRLLTTENLNHHTQDILSKLKNQNIDAVSAQEVAEELEKFLEYGVPVNQAKQTLLKKFGVDTTIPSGPMKRMLLADLEPNQRNVKLVVQIVSVNPKDIVMKGQQRQIYSGLVRDESGTMPFTSWDKIAVSEGEVVEISNAYTKEWRGRVQLNFGSQLLIEKKEKDALPEETFQPKKVTIAQITPLVGSVELVARVLSIEEQEITVDGEKKKMYTGVIGDSTGKIPFTAWVDLNITKDATLHIKGGYIKSFRGMPQVNLDENTTVKKEKKHIDENDIPIRSVQLSELEESPGMYDVTVSGTVIEIQPGSGIVLRCPECTQVLQEEGCRVHGTVDGVADLRIKCIVDDGTGSVKAILNKEKAEQILQKTMDECKQMNPEELQALMRDRLFAQPVKLQGNALQDGFGLTFLVTDVAMVSIDVEQEINRVQELLEELA